ncbi:ABC transporter substrate-binding protein [Orrella sp. NBD-18]|uniref:ABC transporter substrate-binding protein n=1 Tax=Sheuella amnicola TaxID=2707330 RepID=A0A6B2R2A4_9BURK|nr:ABC transporter substrate-binding protein [Sheuella amnicola]
MILKKLTLAVALSLTGFAATTSHAQSSGGAVKIGVLADMSSIYSSIGGKGLVDAAKMAVEDFGGSVLGKPIELLSVDTQNKVDVASSRARQWFDVDGVDMVTDMPTSAIALAVSKLGEEKKKIVMVTSAATSDLTGKACSPYTAHWTYDTYAMSVGTAAAVVKSGGDTWYFLSADYAFGQALERDATQVIEANGGKVLGSAKHPLSAPDFSSFILQAQSSKAKVIGLANGGQDTSNAIKQAAEFGVGKSGQKVAALLAFLSDIKSIGLPLAQGLYLTEAFYWDLNDKTREWSQRFYKRNGVMPTMTQAGTYGAVTHYLQAVKAVGSKDSDKVMAQMRETPINDFMTTNGTLRKDGRVVRDMYLFQVKTPAESKGEWDLYKTIATTPGNIAFRPMDKGGCPFIK